MTDPAPSFPGNIEAAFARVEGNIKAGFAEMQGTINRMADKMDSASEETIRIRDRVHEIANYVTPLVAINIPDKLADHSDRLTALESDRDQRKGAMAVMRAIWAVIGFLGAGALFGIVKALGGI